MKSVHFGSENSSNPTGMHENIGVGEGNNIIVKGDFIGVINIGDNNYLVARTTMAFNDDQVGKITVRRAIADIYPDGSGILYLDQLHSNDCKKLEELLNSNRAQTLLNEGKCVTDICDAHMPDRCFDMLTSEQYLGQYADIVATAIRHEVFEKKKADINGRKDTFSNLQRKINELEAQIRQMREQGSNHHR